MRGMSEPRPISHLEQHLERLIEGAFTRVFGRRLSAHDLALQLARGLEAELRLGQDSDPRLVAPDHYTIRLHPDAQKRLQQAHPDINLRLAQHLVELAHQSGYRLLNPPLVKLIADPQQAPGSVHVHTEHSELSANSTDAMQPITLSDEVHTASQPQFVVDGSRVVALDQALFNVGRSADNDIIIDDKAVSRHHLQVRRRHGAYWLFDVDSRGGTYVNNVLVKEHRLKAGDVVLIGKTRLVYLEDERHAPVVEDTDDIPPVTP